MALLLGFLPGGLSLSSIARLSTFSFCFLFRASFPSMVFQPSLLAVAVMGVLGRVASWTSGVTGIRGVVAVSAARRRGHGVNFCFRALRES
jgi:hypothetical protein